MQRVRQLIILCLICCTCCFGNSLSLTDQSSSTTQQQSSTTDSLLHKQPSSLSIKTQLIKLKRTITRVREDMLAVENCLESNLDLNQLINLQAKTNDQMQRLKREINKFIRQSTSLVNNVKHLKLNDKSGDRMTDQIEQQLSSTNQFKVIQDPKIFFSSSSSRLSPSDFWYVDASSASKNRNLSLINFGNSYSSLNQSSNLVSSNSASSSQSKTIKFNRSKFNSPKSIDNLKNNQIIDVDKSDSLSDKKSDKINQTSIKIKNKFKNSNLISNNLTNRHNLTTNSRKQKPPFLLYHKCSEGYLQLNENGDLNTGMDANLLSHSELIINYLTKPHNHQLQIQTRNGKFLCFNDQGRPEIMMVCIAFISNN